ncbi:MAG: hypothetical protein MUC59_18530 [Saprospiraceae bacterium]|nr:hypothetical protein [Saprospiraceae bacterium]
MKNINQTLVILGLLALSIPGIAQRNEVIYNLFNDSISYKRDGKPVKALRLRKGDEVRVHLTEFNPFTSDVQLEVEEINEPTAAEVSGMAGLGGLLPPMPGGGGVPELPDFSDGESLPGKGFGTADGGAVLLDIPVLRFGLDTAAISKSLGSSLGWASVGQANAMMAEISAVLAELNGMHEAIKAIEKSATVSQIAELNVTLLRQQPNLRPSLVQQMCREYYEAVFKKTPGEAVSLNDLLAWQAMPKSYALLQQQMKSKQGELISKIAVLEGISQTFASLPMTSTSSQQYYRELLAFQSKSKGVRDQITDYTARPASLEDLPTLEEMAELQLELAEVISNDFTYHTTLQPLSDQVVLHMKLQRNAADGEEMQVVKERNLRLEVRGGLKVRASAGVGFGQFFEPAQTFTTSEGVIVADDEGFFSPSIVSFLNFHGYRGQKATLGGTFGAGFPLISNGDGQSFEFYLGPSLMLGASQKLVISTGLKGGRVQRLAKGYELGDLFDTSFGDIPTAGKYELGLFLGLSFILGN